jgi:hypothetical protein
MALMSIDSGTVLGALSEAHIASLFDPVQGFYGSCLQFFSDDNENAPIGRLKFKYNRISPSILKLISVEVVIRLDHERAPLSLVHELLHLELRMRGFPTACANEGYREDDLDLHDWVTNAVDHHLFKARFLDLGYSLDDIVNPASKNDAQLKSWIETFATGYAPRREAMRWAYYIYFISWMLDALKEIGTETRACMAVLEPHVATLSEDMEWLPEWFKRREFSDPSRYHFSMWEALTKLMIPRQPYYVLRRCGSSIQAELAYRTSV